MAIVKGTAMWASIQQPNTQYDPCWTIDVIITEEQANQIMKDSVGKNSKAATAGIRLKKNKTGDYIFKIKRDVKKADGSGENAQPVVRDRRNRDFESLVGNGSIVNVHYDFFPWNNKYGAGVGVDLKGVQVLDLVPYGESDGQAFGDEGGDEEVSPINNEFDEEDL